jgi:hypothetical protein
LRHASSSEQKETGHSLIIESNQHLCLVKQSSIPKFSLQIIKEGEIGAR